MSVIIDITVPTKGDLEFNFTNSVITAENTINDLTAQELANAIRYAEEELLAMSFDSIAKMAGKSDLGSSVVTGIVIELLGWKIVSGKSSGSFTLKDGTITETSSGTEVFDINTLVSQINLATVGGIITSTGSGLSTEEHSQLMEKVLTKVEFSSIDATRR